MIDSPKAVSWQKAQTPRFVELDPGPAFTGSFVGAPVSSNPVRIFSVPGHLLRASAAIPHLYRILRRTPSIWLPTRKAHWRVTYRR